MYPMMSGDGVQDSVLPDTSTHWLKTLDLIHDKVMQSKFQQDNLFLTFTSSCSILQEN